jgi:predicted DNA repair protein MutK
MTGGLFAILDDIAVLLDDAAVMSKLAAKKTAGILGDDLAVNAERATGFRASRELPVLWAITKGSFINKVIIVPLALLLSAYASWLIVPILLLGGCYLSFEGMEKIFHYFSHQGQEKPSIQTAVDERELLEKEKVKIKSAVRTDFILSIEIIMIALGTVMEQPLIMQVIVVTLIAILATVGVYGVVALIVRMDDMGIFLIARAARLKGAIAAMLRAAGSLLVASLPWVIRALGVIGTIAMLLVGGVMFTHNLHALHHAVEVLPAFFINLLVGGVVGTVLLAAQQLVLKIRS